MMNRYFRLRSELCGSIAQKLQHAKNHISVLVNFFDQFAQIGILYTCHGRCLLLEDVSASRCIAFRAINKVSGNFTSVILHRTMDH